MTTPRVYSGDGLIRPLNAPEAGQLLPGVQPGVSGAVVLASYVIIFGSSQGGQAPGMFIYQGSPGPGNPPVYSASNATTDPYGNAISAGIWAGQFGQTQAGLEASGAAGQLLFPVAGSSAPAVGGISGSVVGSGGASVQIFSASDAAPSNDRVFAILQDHQSNGSSSAYFLAYQDTLGTIGVQVQGGAAGVALSSVTGITAVLPGTGTGITNQAQPETWHPATLINGWAGSGSNENGLFYRLVPVGPSGANLVEIKADIVNAGGAPANSVCAVLPSNYRPAPTSQNHPAAVNNPQANNSASFPWISVAPSGNIQVTGLQAVDSTAEVFFHIFVPLGAF